MASTAGEMPPVPRARLALTMRSMVSGMWLPRIDRSMPSTWRVGGDWWLAGAAAGGFADLGMGGEGTSGGCLDTETPSVAVARTLSLESGMEADLWPRTCEGYSRGVFRICEYGPRSRNWHAGRPSPPESVETGDTWRQLAKDGDCAPRESVPIDPLTLPGQPAPDPTPGVPDREYSD